MRVAQKRVTRPRWVRDYYASHRGVMLIVFLLAAVALEVAAGVGLSYVAGFTTVRRVVLGPIEWDWVGWLAAALTASFAGYYFAYRGVFRVDGGPRLPGPQLTALVAASFGGLLAQGGGVDRGALEAAGADETDARARVAALGGTEQGVLALAGSAAAIIVLVYGLRQPPLNTTLPWAVIPVPGMLVAFWVAARYRENFRGRRGWRGLIGTFLQSVHLIRKLFTHPQQGWAAVAGMAVFWLADAFAVWAGLAAFGFSMDAAPLFVGFATGMVFTRRTGPLAGAGVLALLLPVTLHYSGAPLAVAIVGVFTYRIAALWVPLPVSLAFLPILRRMAQQKAARPAAPPRAPAAERL
jgi:hypothetical protein